MHRRIGYAVVTVLFLHVAYLVWRGASEGVILSLVAILCMGAFLVVYGIADLLRSRDLARLSEQLDAVGSTTPRDSIEPVGWKVSLTKYNAVAMLFVGLCTLAIVFWGTFFYA